MPLRTDATKTVPNTTPSINPFTTTFYYQFFCLILIFPSPCNIPCRHVLCWWILFDFFSDCEWVPVDMFHVLPFGSGIQWQAWSEGQALKLRTLNFVCNVTLTVHHKEVSMQIKFSITLNYWLLWILGVISISGIVSVIWSYNQMM